MNANAQTYTDLTPYDFFLWGHLKNPVHSSQPPANIQELEQRIRHHSEELKRNSAMIRRSFHSMIRRGWDCIDLNGGHVEGR